LKNLSNFAANFLKKVFIMNPRVCRPLTTQRSLTVKYFFKTYRFKEITMKINQVIDLSHPLHPGREARTLEISRLDATQLTGAPEEEGWYIMHRVVMDNHLGTHLEVPYHILEKGADLAQIPAEQYIGEAVILDLRGYDAYEGIPLEAVQSAAEKAGGIEKGDLVFCMTGWSVHYGNERYMTPPFLVRQAVLWIVGHNIKVLGIDTIGSMDPDSPDRWNHLPIMEGGVIYIENLTNLAAVPASRVMAAALPPAIEGLEGMPVRVVAFV
jgi:arylformamidase